MPLICFLQNFRRKVAETSRANLLQSTEIVRCCRIIIQEVHSTDFVNDKDFGSIESVLKKAEVALESARMNKPDVCEAFENATNSIVEVGRSMQLNSLLDIEERMNEIKINDQHVGDRKSLRFAKHLKHLARSSVHKSPRITLDIRVRRNIDDESKQEIIEVRGKGNDTLDIVLLSMKLNRSPRIRQSLHFYHPRAIEDLVARRNHRLEPLPFESVLSKISRSSDRLVLYCLHDHESGNYIVLRSQSLRSFTNLWQITLNNAFVLKDVSGTIEHADKSTDVSHDRVKITKKQVSSESVREEMQGVWPELLQEVYRSFGAASNICWTIEAPGYTPRIPSKLAMPKPEPWVSPSNKSSSTLASSTPTLVPFPSPVNVEKKGKSGRSWYKALVEFVM
ncbi:hypothetical protein IW261DRAFT_1461099 [Armillaria novae-zelandiae]|uniref:Uncharacterized protein n=1 Tax=Armillaria novae-zelandiae TaxID=153914 RepID=A0AA39UMS0_9AGAR|nr:hypothetical protein IW261DRAFT_1461099 [Armillaria novae-zelandiae]